MWCPGTGKRPTSLTESSRLKLHDAPSPLSVCCLLKAARVAPFWKCNGGRGRGEGNLKVECKVYNSLRRIVVYFPCLQTISCCLYRLGRGLARSSELLTPLSGLFLHGSSVRTTQPTRVSTASVQGPSPLQRHPLSETLTMAGKTREQRLSEYLRFNYYLTVTILFSADDGVVSVVITPQAS